MGVALLGGLPERHGPAVGVPALTGQVHSRVDDDAQFSGVGQDGADHRPVVSLPVADASELISDGIHDERPLLSGDGLDGLDEKSVTSKFDDQVYGFLLPPDQPVPRSRNGSRRRTRYLSLG